MAKWFWNEAAGKFLSEFEAGPNPSPLAKLGKSEPAKPEPLPFGVADVVAFFKEVADAEAPFAKWAYADSF